MQEKQQVVWVSTGRAAEVYQTSRRTILRYAEQGLIDAQKLPSGVWRVAVPAEKMANLKKKVVKVGQVGQVGHGRDS